MTGIVRLFMEFYYDELELVDRGIMIILDSVGFAFFGKQ